MRIRIIKAKPPEKKKLRVSAYTRVSTDSADQEGSLENQTQYYQEMLSTNSAYEFVGVYSDEGISGYKSERQGFQRMIDDAMAGKIDLIFVKSVSRFARNTEVLLRTVRALKSKGVGVFFELQNINSLSQEGELLLTVYAAFAQGESDSYAEITRMYFRRKYEQGEPSKRVYATYGYYEGEHGDLYVDESQARNVRLIYQLALDGASLSGIAYWLNNHGIPAIQGGTWNATGVRRVLRNVTYKGCLMLQKSYLDSNRKRHPNKGQAECWYIEDNHQPIVSPEEWQAVQDLLDARANTDKPTGLPVAYARTDENGKFLLSGMLYCPHCGKLLHHKWCNNRTTEYWACSTNLKKTRAACEGIFVPAQIAEQWSITEPTTVIEDKDEFGNRRFTPVPKRNYERRVSCPYKK